MFLGSSRDDTGVIVCDIVQVHEQTKKLVIGVVRQKKVERRKMCKRRSPVVSRRKVKMEVFEFSKTFELNGV